MTSKNIFHTVEVIEHNTYYSFQELCSVSALDENWVRELLDYEIISPEKGREQYNESQLTIMLKAHRLQRDLEVNIAGIALALQLMDTIEQQQTELNVLRYLHVHADSDQA